MDGMLGYEKEAGEMDTLLLTHGKGEGRRGSKLDNGRRPDGGGG